MSTTGLSNGHWLNIPERINKMSTTGLSNGHWLNIPERINKKGLG